MFENKPIILNEQMITAIKKYVRVRGENDCWFWIAGRKRRGYGILNTYDNKVIIYQAHRVAYVIAYGSFDWHLDVLHSCDNPPCCNPKHLFLGTDFDNQRDCISKNRKVNHYGEKNGQSKLTQEKIDKIRFKAAMGIPYRDIAKEFDIHYTQVGHIVNYQQWKD